VCGVVLEGGTLTSSAAGFGRSLVRRHFGGAWKRIARSTGVVGTLLGPEGAGDRCFWQGLPAFRTVIVPVGAVGLAGSCGGCLVVR
jgi:hypothetical protein